MINLNETKKDFSYNSVLGDQHKFFNVMLDDKEIGNLECVEKDDILEIVSIYVNQEYRNKGIGKEVLKLLKNDNIKYFIMMVTRQSKRFWMKLGAEPIQKDHYVTTKFTKNFIKDYYYIQL